MSKPHESGEYSLPVPSGVDSTKPSISVVGMGYVGLATSVCFASIGCKVLGVEIDEKKCKLIEEGVSPIHEVGIDTALRNCLKSGTFSCGRDTLRAVLDSDITFVTVGTPSRADGGIELRYIDSAVLEIGKALAEKKNYHLVVVKSTVIPGTSMDRVKQILESASGRKYPDDFGLCVNPEFLREGTAIQDTLRPDALIIGTEDNKSSDTLLGLYRTFYGEDEIPYTLVTETPNAELVKYSVNSFRAVQLSFLNSLANLCEKTPSADVSEVVKGLSAVTKIDKRYLQAGFGYGGSCLPKDLRALTSLLQDRGVNPVVLTATAEINQFQPLRAADIAQQFLGRVNGKRISVLGLTFKANTDDVRESVAMRIASELVVQGATVRVYDPRGMENAKTILQNSVYFAESAISCLEEAECCIIATEWEEFSQIPASAFKKVMRTPIIIDAKRVIDSSSFNSEGVLVYEVGRYSDVEQIQVSQVEPINA